MTQPTRTNRRTTTRLRPTIEFSERVRTNAYRILGLSARATRAEVDEARTRLERALALDVAEPEMPGRLGIPAVRIDHEAVRSATERLDSPSDRCLERLLWFAALPVASEALGDRCAHAPALLDHDTALVALLTRFRSDPDLDTHDEWVRALRRWHEDVESLVAELREIEAGSGHEVTATAAQVRAAGTYAARLPLRAIAGIGRHATLTGDWERVSIAASIIGEAAPDAQQARRLHRQLLHPVADRAELRCDAAIRSARATAPSERRGAGRAAERSRLLRKWYRRRLAPEIHRLSRIPVEAGTRVERVESLERKALATRDALEQACDRAARPA